MGFQRPQAVIRAARGSGGGGHGRQPRQQEEGRKPGEQERGTHGVRVSFFKKEENRGGKKKNGEIAASTKKEVGRKK